MKENTPVGILHVPLIFNNLLRVVDHYTKVSLFWELMKECNTSGSFPAPVCHEEHPEAPSSATGVFQAPSCSCNRAVASGTSPTRHNVVCSLWGDTGPVVALLSCINDAHKRALAWNNALFDYGPIMCSWAVSRALSPPPPTPSLPLYWPFIPSVPNVASAQGRASSVSLVPATHVYIYIYIDRYI